MIAMLAVVALAPVQVKSGVAQAATCQASSALYVKTGLGRISTRNLSCRRAFRTLRRWGEARGHIRHVPPAGWRCSIRVFDGEGGGAAYRCRKGRQRMSFTTGG